MSKCNSCGADFSGSIITLSSGKTIDSLEMRKLVCNHSNRPSLCLNKELPLSINRVNNARGFLDKPYVGLSSFPFTNGEEVPFVIQFVDSINEGYLDFIDTSIVDNVNTLHVRFDVYDKDVLVGSGIFKQ